MGQTAPGPIASLYEFSRLEGPSYVLFSYSGAIFSGATTGQSQGLSFTIQASPYSAWGIIAAIELRAVGLSTASFLAYPYGALYQGDTTAPIYGSGVLGLGLTSTFGGDSFVIQPLSQSDNTLDYTTLNNFMFAADGNKFFKYDGITTYPIGLPPPLWITNAYNTGSSQGGLGIVANSSTAGFGFAYGPSIGTYYIFASYVNNRGFEGPIFPLFFFRGDTQFSATRVLVQAAAPFNGLTSGIMQFSMILATPPQYGISSINLYSFYEAYNPGLGQTYINFLSGSTWPVSIYERFWNLGPPVLMQKVPATGSTVVAFAVGASSQLALQANTIGPLEPDVPNIYSPLGLTIISSTPDTAAAGWPYSLEDLIVGFNPRYLEVYNNRLFLAGFSSMLSTVVFSDVAEPEGYPPDNNFEVRTNDADYITGMKAYSTRLYIFKKGSFHVLSGDNPNNFFLQEVSDQYGCINNKSAVIFGEILAFLDRKGVMTFNGSNLSMLSTKVQPFFDQMNYNVAVNTACMVHDKIRNQILVAIPYGAGVTVNNLTLAYDYVANAWTTYTGFNPTVFAMIQGYNSTKYPLFGDQQGRVNWFGPSFIQDNGAGMTCFFKTRFIHDIGDSIEKQFRRLYLNGDQQGSTLSIPINFYQDYGTSIVLATTLSLGAFQDRIDFGIPAKSLAFDMSAVPTVRPLNIHGFTIEQRLQRRV